MIDPKSYRLDSVDLIKAIALIWVFTNHVAESIWGYPFLGNPSSDWPDVSIRWSQLIPLAGVGISGIAANVLRYVGWFGDQAVGWFILLSGLTLSISQCNRTEHSPDSPDSISAFYLRRFRRILPTWWTVHLLILLPVALLGWRVTIADPRFFLSFAGIRVTPDQLYFGVPAWWFISLLLQLYLVFPWLHKMLRGIGPTRGGIILIVGSLVIRGWGLATITPEWLDAWNRGAIFITRLPEFVTGMWLAFVIKPNSENAIAWLKPRRILAFSLFGLVALVIGNLSSITLLGMTFAPWLMAIGGVGLAHVGFQSQPWHLVSKFFSPPLRWIGKNSLTLFLVHHPVVWFLLRHQRNSQLTGNTLLRIGGAIVITLGLTAVVDWLARRLLKFLDNGVRKWRVAGLLTRITVAIATLVLAVLPFEAYIRKTAPQDITDFGWSERPSLIPDDVLGFRLQPNATTRLQWESYDYVVTANSDGFPGPEVPSGKSSDTFRVMTLGDAFTSAEGVDTDKSWPRQLETRLRSASGNDRFDVVNFGITGFGPNQYASLVETYAPKIQPDLIVVGFFTNDYVDVQASASEFKEMIGFDKPPANTWLSLLTGRNLTRYLRSHVAETLLENVTGEPCSHTRFFAQSDLFDRNNTDYVEAGRDLVRQRFAEIKNVADKIGADVCVMSIPAPIQAVPTEQLKYIRGCLDLKNQERYDYEHPQRLTALLAGEFGFEHLDLRPKLAAASARQPYQAHNLHFTEAGHEIVSGALLPIVQRHAQRR